MKRTYNVTHIQRLHCYGTTHGSIAPQRHGVLRTTKFGSFVFGGTVGEVLVALCVILLGSLDDDDIDCPECTHAGGMLSMILRIPLTAVTGCKHAVHGVRVLGSIMSSIKTCRFPARHVISAVNHADHWCCRCCTE